MSFIKYQVREARAGNVSGTGLTANLVKFRSAPARLFLNFRIAAIEAIGLTDGDRIEVLLGTDADFGRLRIRKNNSVGSAIARQRNTRGARYIRIDLGHIDIYPDRAEKAGSCGLASAEGGWVEIALPSWIATDQRQPAQARSPEPVKRVVDRAPGIMGDPAPGRSALDKRGAP